jgi:hypothetical protein
MGRESNCGLRIADCGLRIADCGLRIADCGLRIADCGLRKKSTAKEGIPNVRLGNAAARLELRSPSTRERFKDLAPEHEKILRSRRQKEKDQIVVDVTIFMYEDVPESLHSVKDRGNLG